MPPLEILSLTDKTVGFRFIENQDRFTFEIDREYAATKMHLILKILDSGKTNFLDVATVDREIISFAIDPDGSSVITFLAHQDYFL
ncbi:MAG: hypothetical protein IPO31_05845 [Candidatus Obscuribacter sp.]|nr:hypothetical protein [Candidatus Obscuribacter sp.]